MRTVRALICPLLAGGLSLAATAQPTDAAAASGAAWSPYLAGAGIGLLVISTFYFSGKPLGASGAYSMLAGLLGRSVAPRYTRSLPYYQETAPKLDWEVFLVGGVVVGALLAAGTGGEITGRWIPPLWGERFGEGIALRTALAFAGGAVMAFGARLAGGCTSGHGISGTLQLSVGSWIAVVCFFIGGILTAHLMYRV